MTSAAAQQTQRSTHRAASRVRAGAAAGGAGEATLASGTPGPYPPGWSVELRAMMTLACRRAPFDDDRRRQPREPYHAIASAELADASGAAHTTQVYTRDLSPRHVAFICCRVMPAKAAVTVTLPMAAGQTRSARGTVLRCRQFYDGWFEVVVRFDPPRPSRRRWFAPWRS